MSIQRPLGSLLITAPTGSHPVSLTAILYFQGDKNPTDGSLPICVFGITRSRPVSASFTDKGPLGFVICDFR